MITSSTQKPTPGSSLKLLIVIGNAIALVFLSVAVKYQILPAENDETPMALGMAAPTFGTAFLLLSIGALLPYSWKWRAVFIAPIALYLCSLLISFL